MAGQDVIMNGRGFHDDSLKFIMNGPNFHNSSRFIWRQVEILLWMIENFMMAGQDFQDGRSKLVHWWKYHKLVF